MNTHKCSRSSSTRLEASSTVQDEMRRSSQDLSEFSSATKWRIPVVRQRTAAARAVPESEAKSKIPIQRDHKKIEIPQSQLVRQLSGLSTKQPVTKMAMEMQFQAERRRSDGDQQSEINLARGKQQDCDSVEQHPSVQACLRRCQQASL